MIQDLLKDQVLIDLMGQYAEIDSRTGGINKLDYMDRLFSGSMAKKLSKYGVQL